MHYTVGDTISLYERNYELLLQLVPRLDQLSGSVELRVGDERTLRIAVTERSVYSSGIDLTYHVGAPEGWLTDVHLAVRLYHDAQVAEVMGYQHQIYRRPWYGGQDIPGRKPCEKRQINLFLNECLNHCRRKGCHVVAQVNLTTM